MSAIKHQLLLRDEHLEGSTPTDIIEDVLFNHPAFQSILDTLYSEAVHAPDFQYFLSSVKVVVGEPLTVATFNEVNWNFLATKIYEDTYEERQDIKAVRADRERE